MTFIDKGGKIKKQPVFVVAGDEDFLKRRVLSALQTAIVGEADPSFAVSTYSGDKADFATIRNELETLPFLSECRLVIVEKADDRGRKQGGDPSDQGQGEASADAGGARKVPGEAVAAPSPNGVLVLEVKSWPATTKLAKAIPAAATIEAKTPKDYALPAWCIQWAQAAHQKKLPKAAAELLVEIVGPHMGLLDSELEKLAIYAGDRPSIEVADVDLLVGRSREANVFKILDSVGDGKPAQALTILAELFEEGEVPQKILGALGAARRLGVAARLHKLGTPLDDAMDRAGVAKWDQARSSAVKQMKHLGWNRLDSLFDWLVEIDLGIKGGSPLPEKLQLERLIVRLARPRAASG